MLEREIMRAPYIFILLMYFLSCIGPTKSQALLPDFDTAMICRQLDSAEYNTACSLILENRTLFDFARNQYTKYIIEQAGYSTIERIPKIIHQIWIGPDAPPREFWNWQKTWQEMHPEWEYILWTDTEVNELQLVNQDLYDAQQNYGAKADILRLELLDQFGGLYVDIDCECLHSFDTLHHLVDFYIGFFQVNFLRSSARVNNAVIGASPHNPLIKQAISMLSSIKNSRAHTEDEVVEQTGPSFITKVIKNHIYSTKGIATLLPANYFYPWSGTRRKMKLLVQPETMAIHYYAGTWHEHKKRIRSTLDKQSDAYKALQLQREAKKQFLFASYKKAPAAQYVPPALS